MKRRYTRAELRDLLGVVEDPDRGSVRELRPARRAPSAQELFVLWSAARAEANIAYDEWCAAPGTERYLVYRAAEDRADAAQASLARGGLAA